ncbi:4-hydroxythreonine-4-phosphate dehydrogenase PdxA [candidate division WOR-3 bacterium]|nr:4-hydroxythreonine-4-phosphate dehydrogenase PdxA [candidate division WOR-3 bacterium]
MKESGARPLDHLTTRPHPLGITCGDPAGIGPEIILKALDRMPRLRPRIIGPRDVFEREQKRFGTRVDLSLVDDSVEGPGRYQYGKPQESCGCTALLALETGVYRLLKKQISALVTAPVSKEALRMAGFGWPGQTEFLAERLGSRRHAMLAWTPKFKVVFVTIHEPLARVCRHITAAAVVEKVVLLNQFLRSSGVRRPRICVMAFNPHAAEFSLGEERRIAVGVTRARKAGINAIGPVPADAAVASVTRFLSFDGYVAMYHDQAMIPAKLLGRDRGVNLTLGLGCVRTSPLHGVAFDIAGKGVASAGSMLSAIRLARRLSRTSSR